jgi:hypothetical protein
MTPVVRVQETGKQVLFTTLTFSGGADKSGQEDWPWAVLAVINIKKTSNA